MGPILQNKYNTVSVSPIALHGPFFSRPDCTDTF